MCLRNFAESLAIVLRGSRVYTIDYTARKSRYEHQDESCQTPLMWLELIKWIGSAQLYTSASGDL